MERVSLIKDWTWASTDTSHGTKMASPPASRIASTVALPPVASMSDTTTFKPRAAKATAAARPMPLPAPVTKATVPENSMLMASPSSLPSM